MVGAGSVPDTPSDYLMPMLALVMIRVMIRAMIRVMSRVTGRVMGRLIVKDLVSSYAAPLHQAHPPQRRPQSLRSASQYSC